MFTGLLHLVVRTGKQHRFSILIITWLKWLFNILLPIKSYKFPSRRLNVLYVNLTFIFSFKIKILLQHMTGFLILLSTQITSQTILAKFVTLLVIPSVTLCTKSVPRKSHLSRMHLRKIINFKIEWMISAKTTKILHFRNYFEIKGNH